MQSGLVHNCISVYRIYEFFRSTAVCILVPCPVELPDCIYIECVIFDGAYDFFRRIDPPGRQSEGEDDLLRYF